MKPYALDFTLRALVGFSIALALHNALDGDWFLAVTEFIGAVLLIAFFVVLDGKRRRGD